MAHHIAQQDYQDAIDKIRDAVAESLRSSLEPKSTQSNEGNTPQQMLEGGSSEIKVEGEKCTAIIPPAWYKDFDYNFDEMWKTRREMSESRRKRQKLKQTTVHDPIEDGKIDFDNLISFHVLEICVCVINCMFGFVRGIFFFT